MHAILTGGAGALSWGEIPTPAPGPGQVRIRVAATAVNRADLLQRQGRYPPPPGASEILGLEAAGVVEAVGDGVSAWSVGDRVAALLSGGGYATRVVCPAGHLLPVPEGMGLEQAAALPEALTTAWLNLFVEGAARPGDRVMLHAGASGVGTAAVQLCAAMGVACWVTVGSQDKLSLCLDLGASGGCNRHEQRFVDLVPGWTDKCGFDVILDPVGGAYLADNQRSLATGGRLVLIGLLGGRIAEVDLGRLLIKRQRVLGSVLRARSDAEKAEIITGLRAAAWPLVESGRVRPVIHAVMDAREAHKAHQLVASNTTAGKVVLTLP